MHQCRHEHMNNEGKGCSDDGSCHHIGRVVNSQVDTGETDAECQKDKDQLNGWANHQQTGRHGQGKGCCRMAGRKGIRIHPDSDGTQVL